MRKHKMNKSTKDKGVIEALIERFETQRLPRTLEIKKHVDAGKPLSDSDLLFLEEVNQDALRIKPLVERHPKYQALYAKAVQLHEDIVQKALENEKN